MFRFTVDVSSGIQAEPAEHLNPQRQPQECLSAPAADRGIEGVLQLEGRHD